MLSNHDNPRHRTRYGGDEARARAAAVLLLTLRGTPFMYQGEELGLEDAVIAPEDMEDPGGRDGCRAPIPWAEANDNDMLDLYMRLLEERRGSPALQAGDFNWLQAEPGVLRYERVAADDRREITIDFVHGRAAIYRNGELRLAT